MIFPAYVQSHLKPVFFHALPNKLTFWLLYFSALRLKILEFINPRFIYVFIYIHYAILELTSLFNSYLIL